MVGPDLTDTPPPGPIPVVLDGAEEASGLAEMVQQFLEQVLAESPRKARRARRLSGAAVLRSAEDEDVAVRIRFAGDRIELSDGAAIGSRDATITADFLTIAHLTSGQESPFRLLADRRLRARFALTDVPFLLGVLSLMRSRPAARAEERKRRRRLLWLAVPAAAGAGVLCWWWLAGTP
jgi:hypothetical protein